VTGTNVLYFGRGMTRYHNVAELALCMGILKVVISDIVVPGRQHEPGVGGQ
jgi:hypothetical protein